MRVAHHILEAYVEAERFPVEIVNGAKVYIFPDGTRNTVFGVERKRARRLEGFADGFRGDQKVPFERKSLEWGASLIPPVPMAAFFGIGQPELSPRFWYDNYSKGYELGVRARSAA